MLNTPRGMRIQIGVFGRRNAGKSSFVNAVTGQPVSIVSEFAGTTTDPVEKAMELLPLGPVLFIDTAGIDDAGSLGELRVGKTRKIMERTDVAVLVAEAGCWDAVEDGLLETFTGRGVPVVVVFSKCDLREPDSALCERLGGRGVPFMRLSPENPAAVPRFREILARIVPEELITPAAIVGDLLHPGDMVVLVVPIDLEAPKGRLILPQVQTIRDILDHDAYCTVVKERELRDVLESFKVPPALVVTDSQAFLKVAADTPPDVPMTSFSILFARFKGDLTTFVEGALAIDRLRPGDRVLIAEACTHHPIGEDIGRVKIPRWLEARVGGRLDFVFARGHDFPEDLSGCRLVIHCGSCTFNRRQLLTRILKCREAGVPITNYGLCVAHTMGLLERALAPFPNLREKVVEAARKAEAGV